MTISQTITVYTDDVPNKDTMTADEFDAAANAWVDYWTNTVPSEINTWAEEANATKTDINEAESSALIAIDEAESSAISAVESARLDPIIYGDEVYQYFAAEDRSAATIETWWDDGQNAEKFTAMQQDDDALDQFLSSSIAITNAEKYASSAASLHENMTTMTKWMCHATSGLSTSSYDDLSTLLGNAVDFGKIANSATGMAVLLKSSDAWDAVIGNATSLLEILKSQVALDLVWADTDKRSDILTTAAVRAEAAGSEDAVTMLISLPDWRGEILTDTDWIGALFGSVDAKRALFESQDAEIAIRESQVAMDALVPFVSTVSDDIERSIYGAPAPLNTAGKWFVVAISTLSDVTTDYRGAKNFKHHSPDFETSSTFEVYTHISPFDPPALTPDGLSLEVTDCPLSGRFYTEVAIMTNSAASSSFSMEIHYIDMDS